MSQNSQHFSEPGDIQNLGPSKYRVVRSDDSDRREWLADSPICPLLSQHHIAHVGILWARYPFELMRTYQSGSYIMACFEGMGEILVDGSWKTLKAGEACLLPPFVLNTFKCIERVPWDFCWVRYLESRESKPIISQNSPVLGSYDPAPLLAAIQGVHAECMGVNNPSALNHWIDLIHQYVLRFAQPHEYDDRLWNLVWKGSGP